MSAYVYLVLCVTMTVDLKWYICAMLTLLVLPSKLLDLIDVMASDNHQDYRSSLTYDSFENIIQ